MGGEASHALPIQAYGTPPAMLSTNRLADLPEGEGAQWKALGTARWASSASHLYGRPVTSSEAWTWLHSPAFRATPLDMKAEADLHFLQGVNQLLGHGWPYTGPLSDYPGWRFYAAGALNDQNPWWIVMPDLTRYLQRVSFLLRQGQPANDVALYLPNHDAWAQFRNQKVNLFETLRDRMGKDVVATVLGGGYGLDFLTMKPCVPWAGSSVGALVLGDNRYKAVILPNVKLIPLETLRKLADFAEHGGIVIATRRLPEGAPGFKVGEAEQKDVGETAPRCSRTLAPPATSLPTKRQRSRASSLRSSGRTLLSQGTRRTWASSIGTPATQRFTSLPTPAPSTARPKPLFE